MYQRSQRWMLIINNRLTGKTKWIKGTIMLFKKIEFTFSFPFHLGCYDSLSHRSLGLKKVNERWIQSHDWLGKCLSQGRRSYQLGPDVSSKDDSWSRYGPRCQSLTWSRRRKRPWQRRSPKKKRLTKKRKWRFRRENVPETGMRFQELKNRSSWYQHWESKKLSLVNSYLQRRPRDGLNQMPLPGKEFGSTGNEF